MHAILYRWSAITVSKPRAGWAAHKVRQRAVVIAHGALHVGDVSRTYPTPRRAPQSPAPTPHGHDEHTAHTLPTQGGAEGSALRTLADGKASTYGGFRWAGGLMHRNRSATGLDTTHITCFAGKHREIVDRGCRQSYCTVTNTEVYVRVPPVSEPFHYAAHASMVTAPNSTVSPTLVTK